MSADTNHEQYQRQILEWMLKITGQLSEMNSTLKASLQRLDNHDAKLDKHESQIVELEKHHVGGQTDSSMKDTIILWLVKALIFSGAAVASLTGAGTLLSKVFQP